MPNMTIIECLTIFLKIKCYIVMYYHIFFIRKYINRSLLFLAALSLHKPIQLQSTSNYLPIWKQTVKTLIYIRYHTLYNICTKSLTNNNFW